MALSEREESSGGGVKERVKEQIKEGLPIDRLKQELQDFTMALAQRAMKSAGGKLPGLAQNLGKKMLGGTGGIVKKVAGAGVDKVKEAVTGGGGGDGGKQGGKGKVTNIVEDIDVGVPISRRLQPVDAVHRLPRLHEEGRDRRAGVGHRAQLAGADPVVPPRLEVDDHRAGAGGADRVAVRGPQGLCGRRGHLPRARTRLTKILVVLEYYPQGFFEYVGNLWRAQGRRVRLELKHFRRHVMTQAMLAPGGARRLAGRDPRQ